MENKKAADRLGWKTEWIKEGGDEMLKSLYISFSKIKTENQIPKQWHLTNVSINMELMKTFERIKKGYFC